MSNKEIVEREFSKTSGRCIEDVKAYEAPAAESWVVLLDGEAWVASSDREEFVFWGPKGAGPISFELPSDWQL